MSAVKKLFDEIIDQAILYQSMGLDYTTYIMLDCAALGLTYDDCQAIIEQCNDRLAIEQCKALQIIH